MTSVWLILLCVLQSQVSGDQPGVATQRRGQRYGNQKRDHSHCGWWIPWQDNSAGGSSGWCGVFYCYCLLFDSLGWSVQSCARRWARVCCECGHRCQDQSRGWQSCHRLVEGRIMIQWCLRITLQVSTSLHSSTTYLMAETQLVLAPGQ